MAHCPNRLRRIAIPAAHEQRQINSIKRDQTLRYASLIDPRHCVPRRNRDLGRIEPLLGDEDCGVRRRGGERGERSVRGGEVSL